MDVTKAINDIKAGKIEYRLDKTNIIHVPVGKVSFGSEKLAENFQTLMSANYKSKTPGYKGSVHEERCTDNHNGPRRKSKPCEKFPNNLWKIP